MRPDTRHSKLPTVAAEVGGRIHYLPGGPVLFCTDHRLAIESANHHGLHGASVRHTTGGCIVYWPLMKESLHGPDPDP